MIKWYSTTKNNLWQYKEYNESSQPAQSSISWDNSYKQSIDGFGGCFNELGYSALMKISPEKRAEILDKLFTENSDGVRLNFCRTPIGASDYALKWYSYNETEGDYAMEHFSIERDRQFLVPYINEALKRKSDIKIFASPWSPPVWMKSPSAYNYGTLIWTKENLKAYALYFLKYIKAYESEGISISQVHVQNEPVSSQKFPSCIWTGEQFAEFIGEYLGPLFKENNINTEIWLGTINAPETDDRALYTRYNDYANLVLHDEKAYKYISGVSYQWAGKAAIAQTHMSFPEMKLMQSENECGDGENTWEYARYINEMFIHYLSNEANSYIYWNMALEPKGESTWGWKQNSMITVIPEEDRFTYNYEYYIMKHYSYFISRGAKRLGLTGHWTATSVLFQNPDDSIVLVTANPFQKQMKISFEYGEQKFNFDLEPDSVNTIVIDRY